MDIRTIILGVVCFSNLSQCLKIQAHTTSGCSDTVSWIQTQLKSVYQEFSEYLEIEFVPWGRTVRNADGGLTCQFGTADCWANRVHRCALSLLSDQDKKVEYMDCEFASNTNRPAFLQGTYTCGLSVGLDKFDLDFCVNSVQGDLLAEVAQGAATVPMQVINFVPALVLDEDIDTATHNNAFRQLRTTVCQKLVEDPDVPITSC